MRSHRRRHGALLATVLCVVAIVGFATSLRADLLTDSRDGIGKPAMPWEQHVWLNSSPLTLKQLKGKVVLVRFWTEGCPYCAHSAPALNEFHRRYAPRGLVVVGMYHPKPPRNETPQAVARAARRLGFEFPVALDNDWTTLRRWWLSTGGRDFTSATFLIDRQGILRAIHPGGEFHADGGPGHAACQRDYAALRREIERLLG